MDKMIKLKENNILVSELHNLGVDAEIGLKYCGDLDFYIEVLRISVESYKERKTAIALHVGEKDFKAYTILVHSIKSGAANIGAMELSSLAQKLEEAGKRNDYGYIMDNHDFFLQRYIYTMEGITEIIGLKLSDCGANDIKEERQVSLDEIKNSIEDLDYCLQELELDRAQELVDEMLTYMVAAEAKDALKSIKAAIEHFNVEGAKEKYGILVNLLALM